MFKRFFNNLFSKRKSEVPVDNPEFSVEEFDKNYDEKTAGLEAILGKMHGMVGHAIIPFDVGGAVDMYYFPNHIPGTGFATMELLDPAGNGPKPNRLGTYELVAFTRLLYNENEKVTNAFNSIERRFCGIFTMIGNYSTQAVLNPNETCELPTEGDEKIYLIFDNYVPDSKEFTIGSRKHHLLLCLEVFKSEIEYARNYGSLEIIEKLKAGGYYPYSDMDRDPVV